MNYFELNDRVIVIGKNTKGRIAYIGETKFADGEMFGVILDEPKGKYSGTIDNVCYFKCPENHGTFVRACQLEKDYNYALEDWSRPAYPNYLKESGSKHGLKIQATAPKKENSFKSKLKTSRSSSSDVSRKKQLHDKEWNTPVYQNRLKESSSKDILKIKRITSKTESYCLPKSKTSDAINVDFSRNKLVRNEDKNITMDSNRLKEILSMRELKIEENGLKSKLKTKRSASLDVSRKKQLHDKEWNTPEYQNRLKESRSKYGRKNKRKTPKTENRCLSKSKSSDATNIDSSRNKLVLNEDKNKTMDSNRLKESCSMRELKVEENAEKLEDTETKVKSTTTTIDTLEQPLKEDFSRSLQPHLLNNRYSTYECETKETSKSENNETIGKTLDLEKLEASKNSLLQNEIFQKGEAISTSCFEKNKEHLTDEELILDELSASKQTLSYQEMQMNAVRCYLRMLNTYFKWTDEYEKSERTGDDHIGNVLNLLTDNVIKKIQNLVRQKPGEKTLDSFKESSSVSTEEKIFLLLCIAALEKRNDVLTESLTRVKDILERAWNRYQSSKFNCTESHNRAEPDQNDCKNCTIKISFTDIIEEEIRLFVKTNPVPKTEPGSCKMFEKLNGPERIKRYLETLMNNKESSISDTEVQTKDAFQLTSHTDVLTELKTTLHGQKSNQVKTLNHTIKELKEFIAEMSAKANGKGNPPTQCSKVDSSRKLHKSCVQKSSAGKNTSRAIGDISDGQLRYGKDETSLKDSKQKKNI